MCLSFFEREFCFVASRSERRSFVCWAWALEGVKGTYLMM